MEGVAAPLLCARAAGETRRRRRRREGSRTDGRSDEATVSALPLPPFYCLDRGDALLPTTPEQISSSAMRLDYARAPEVAGRRRNGTLSSEPWALVAA